MAAESSCHSHSQETQGLVPDVVPESGQAGDERIGSGDPPGRGRPHPSWHRERRPDVATTPPTLDPGGALRRAWAACFGVAEVAEQLGVCNATVYRLCESGELPHLRVVNSIRIRPKDLADYDAGSRPSGSSSA